MGVNFHRLADGAQVAHAFKAIGPLPDPIENWNQDGDQDCNDGNDNKELYESECRSFFPFVHSMPLSRFETLTHPGSRNWKKRQEHTVVSALGLFFRARKNADTC